MTDESHHRYIGFLSQAFLYNVVDNPNISLADFKEVDDLDAERRWRGIPSMWD